MSQAPPPVAPAATSPSFTLPQWLATAQEALARGDTAQASAAVERALALDPDDHRALHKAAEIALAGNQLETAVGSLARLRDLQPANPQLRHDLAMVMARCGRHADACAELRTALELSPRLLLVRLHLGMCLLLAGETVAACGEFMRSLELAESQLPPPLLDTPLVRDRLATANATLQTERARVFAEALAPLRGRHGDAALQRIAHCIEAYLGQRDPQYAHPERRPGQTYFPGHAPRPFFEHELIDPPNPQLSNAERDAFAVALEAIDDFHARAMGEPWPAQA